MFKENRHILYTLVTLTLLLSGNMFAQIREVPVRDSLSRDSLQKDSVIRDSMTVEKFSANSLDMLGLSHINLDSLSKVNLRRDSILSLSDKERRNMIKDSLKKVHVREKFVKDSIRIATPRILNTYAIPDSMQYKRIIVWNIPEKVNDFVLTHLDSTYGEWITEYPFLKKDVNATYLGTVGSATESHNYFKRDEQEDFQAFTPYNIYSYTPETVPLYNTKGPYTELAYWGTIFAFKDKEELNLRFLHTQNVTPKLNFSLLYEKFGSKGFLMNEATDSRSTVVATNYLGERYLMNAGYIRHSIKRQENGGLTDMKWMKDTLVDAKTIPIHLTKADNRYVKNTAFLKHSYAFPIEFRKRHKDEQAEEIGTLSDSLSLAEVSKTPADTTAASDTTKVRVNINDVTAIHIGHMFEFSSYSKKYTDEISTSDEVGRAFYDNVFNLHPTLSRDSIGLRTVDNKFYVRLQPWITNAILSKIDIGVGYQWANAYTFHPKMYLTGNRGHHMHNTYVYAGTGGKFRKYLKWDAYADYYLLGYKQNDFSVNANVSTAFYPFKNKKKPVLINARFQTSLKRPDWFSNNFYSNHYIWSNDFKKVSRTSIEGEVKIPSVRFSAFIGYSLVNNLIYYDNKGIVRQHDGLLNVLSAYVREDFKFWYVHLDNQVLFQLSSNQDVLPLPMFSVRLRYYFEFTVVKNAMKMQIGADGSYNSAYYAPAFNPVTGTFHTQNIEKTGNCPYIDIFVNVQWKSVNLFLKCTNVAEGAFNGDYSSGYQYMLPKRGFKLGIHWPFFIK